jgi:hypothetical protein
MRSRNFVVLAIVVGAISAAIPAVVYAWNRCGPPAHNAKQWKHNAQLNGTWNHLVGIVRSHAKTYHFHPVDGDTVNSWFNRQVIVLPLAHAGTIPNTGCLGMSVGKLDDKQVAARWPVVVALPDNLTNKDVRGKKSKRFPKREVIPATFLGQASCINSTSRADVEEVIGFVRRGHKPHKPKPPKPPVVVPPPGNCNGNNSGAQNGNCSAWICSGIANCNTIVVPPCNSCEQPPPSHFTSLSCTGFEEVSGGGSFLVDCDVDNDNGATITLDAHSNNGNSRVSGINCYSQGGTPSCQGKGMFEFRVSGINDSSSIVYSSITVTASSNGVDKTFNSDPFPVDPSDGGF